MKEDLAIESIVARPGTRARGFVVVAESAAGTRVRVPVILVNGLQTGPTLLLASGVHGDDLTTVPVVWRIAATIEPDRLRGQLIAVPVVNPLAFEAGSHRTPEDNATPGFPGDRSGTISQRIGYHVYHQLIARADYVIDMHGGSKNATLATLAHIDGGGEPAVFARARALAAAFGPQIIVVQEPRPDQSQLGMAQIASRDGKPGVYLGLGRLGFNEADTARGTAGVLNMLRHLGLLPGEPEASDPPPLMMRSEHYQYTSTGGSFFPAATAGQEVQERDLLGTVVDVFGQPAGEIRADVSGIVDAIRFYPVISAGDWVASIARWSSGPGDRL